MLWSASYYFWRLLKCPQNKHFVLLRLIIGDFKRFKCGKFRLYVFRISLPSPSIRNEYWYTFYFFFLKSLWVFFRSQSGGPATRGVRTLFLRSPVGVGCKSKSSLRVIFLSPWGVLSSSFNVVQCPPCHLLRVASLFPQKVLILLSPSGVKLFPFSFLIVLLSTLEVFYCTVTFLERLMLYCTSLLGVGSGL